MDPIIVYSPQLDEEFEVTEIRGNAIHTTKGAVLSKKFISKRPEIQTEQARRIFNKGL